MTTLTEIINEGQEIRKGITYVNPLAGVIRMYDVYRIPDTKAYGSWKNRAIRVLDFSFHENRCVKDFETAIGLFEKRHYDPSKLDDAIGVLISCEEILTPQPIKPSWTNDIENISFLETEYVQLLASGKDNVNKQATIDAFHKWYDALVRFLSPQFDESNTNFKQILNINVKGNGFSLRDEYHQIKSKAHILLDEIEAKGESYSKLSTHSEGITTNKVFIVHGHDTEMKESVARLLERIGLEPVILGEQPDKGRTIIEKFEEESNVGYAIVLMSDQDDHGCEITSTELKPRARQNVILELGYFMGKLGRKGHVCVLKKGDIEEPSDILGIIYKPFDSDNGYWKYAIADELKAAGYKVDKNDI